MKAHAKQRKTTHKERFILAIEQMLGRTPPPEFVDEWLGNIDIDGVFRLQDWVTGQAKLPEKIEWAQSIAVLDAAEALAASPEEGVGHEP